MKAVTPAATLRWSRVAPLRRIARSLDGHAVLAASFVLAVALAALAVVPPSAPVLDAERGIVISVAPGTAAWNYDVRPGTPAVIGHGDGDNTFRALVDDHEVVVSLRPRLQPSALAVPAVALFLIVALASMSAAAAVPVAAAATFVAGLVVTTQLGGILAAPVLLSAPTIAALFALGPQRRLRAYRHAAVALLTIAVTAHVAAIASGHQHWADVQVAVGIITAALLVMGWIGSLAAHWAAAAAEVVDVPRGPLRVRLFARSLLDELLPGRDRARLAAGEAERRRLAADLHAKVLPEIDRAASPDELADRITARVRQIMNERHSPVLSALGLLPAVEELVEIVAARNERVELLVETDVDPDAPRAPRAVEVAAYRVAELAIDNALRHADAGLISVTVAEAGPRKLWLRVADDGRGIDPEHMARALRSGHRGVSDMRLHADSVGAQLRIEALPTRGTEVELRWKH